MFLFCALYMAFMLSSFCAGSVNVVSIILLMYILKNK